MVQHVQYFRAIVLKYERQGYEDQTRGSWRETRGLLKRIQTSKFSRTTSFTEHQHWPQDRITFG